MACFFSRLMRVSVRSVKEKEVKSMIIIKKNREWKSERVLWKGGRADAPRA